MSVREDGMRACRSRSSESVTAVPVGLGRAAPVWVPDSASSSCQECNQPFTFIVRRHHCRFRVQFSLFSNNDAKYLTKYGIDSYNICCCRSCGRLLCSSCSSFICPLPYLNWVNSRVCQACKTSLDSPLNPPRRSRSLSSISTSQGNITDHIDYPSEDLVSVPLFVP